MSEQNLTNFDNLNEQIAILLLSNAGITDHEISKRLNISRATANKRRNSRQVQAILEAVFGDQKTQIKKLISKSLSVVENDLSGEDEQRRSHAALAILKLFSEQLNRHVIHEQPQQEMVYIAEWGNAPIKQQ